MRHLIRGLILASVLVTVLPRSQALSAAQLVCFEGGLCSATCDPCRLNTDCPTENGVKQLCVCDNPYC